MLDTQEKNTLGDFVGFYQYCMEWYGPDSKHYPDYDADEILFAAMSVCMRNPRYFTAERIENFPFDGDSMDRWAVRMIMDYNRGETIEDIVNEGLSRKLYETEQRATFGQLLSETTPAPLSFFKDKSTTQIDDQSRLVGYHNLTEEDL